MFQDVRSALQTIHSNSPDPTALLHTVCEPIGRAFRCQEVSIFLLAAHGLTKRFHLHGTTYPVDWIKYKDYEGIKDEGLTGWVLHEKAPILIPDLTHFEQQKIELNELYPGISFKDSAGLFARGRALLNLREEGALPPISYMASPIQSRTELLGCIRCALGKDPYYFSWRELNILESIAGMIAETWAQWLNRCAQDAEKEISLSLLGSASKQSEGFLRQITQDDYDRVKLYQIAAASLARDRFGGCKLVSFRMLEPDDLNRVRLFALEAAPELYSAPAISELLRQETYFYARADGQSIVSRLLNSRLTEAQRFDLQTDGDAEERAFFGAARYVLSTPVMIDKRKHGVFDLGSARVTDFETAFPRLRGFAEMFARNLALHEFLAEQHARLEDLLATQIQTYVYVSHQLKSPLRVAVQRITEMVDRLSSPDGWKGYAIEKGLPIILGQCKKASRVASLVELFAKVARGEEIEANTSFHRVTVFKKMLFESLVDHQWSIGRHSRVTFNMDILNAFLEENQSLRIFVDLKLAVQAIDAIVGNAFKYSRRGEIVSVEGALWQSDFAVIVASKGVRLTPEEATHCTEKYWRSEEAKEVDAEGSGLGLYLTNLIMKAQKGSLSPIATSSTGETCMELRFKAGQQESDRHE